MKADSDVSVRALQSRLTRTRTAQSRGAIIPYNKSSASGLLVSEEWLKDALETRALELENLIVERSGFDDSGKFRVIRKVHLVEVFEIDASGLGEARRLAQDGKTKPSWTERTVLEIEAKEME